MREEKMLMHDSESGSVEPVKLEDLVIGADGVISIKGAPISDLAVDDGFEDPKTNYNACNANNCTPV
jgi:hypothetical protein